jgi:hypothetical protein
MQRSVLVIVIACIGILYFAGCESQPEKEERLAKQYCGSCHTFPDPALLSKKTWTDQVLPQMAFRMGFSNMQMLMQMSDADREIVVQALPPKPMLSEEEFELIRKYYERLAPDSLTQLPPPVTKTITQFDITPVKLPVQGIPLVTLIKADTLHRKIYIGNRYGKLYTFTNSLQLEDSVQLESPPSHILIDHDSVMALLMGIMDPNDQAHGKLVNLHEPKKAVLESLQRPVHVQKADLNNDGLPDYIVCAFGNYTGALQVYENLGNNTYKKHVILGMPGARNTIIKDFDNNGLPDIAALMTQGDEKIVMLLNQGSFNFRLSTLVQFPPVYGSSYFELIDFNNDDKLDILYSNGDNADYSITFKPYHGIRIYMNDGTNHFTQSWFHDMYGASQVRAADYDKDGDIDIAAISFFPDFKHHPENGFFYFENTGNGFVTQTTPLASAGRWLVMEAADIDHDKDIDILLGALDFDSDVPRPLLEQWMRDKTSILLLRNSFPQKAQINAE